MSNDPASFGHPELPEGWRLLASEEAAGRVRALQSEMSHDHPLWGVPLTAMAARGANDDVLYRHREDPGRVTVVHLTWTGRRERTPLFPSIEFDGTYAEFLVSERRLAQDR